MAIVAPKDKGEFIAFLRKCFSDFYKFDEFLSAGLSKLVDDMLAGRLVQHKVCMKFLVDNYSSAALDKIEADQMKIVLAAAYLAHIQQSEIVKHLVISNAGLLEAYPSFASEDEEEQSFLCIFRNLLVIALTFIPAKGNKIFLIKVVERLEGSNNEYVTGSGQKSAVTRRVLIYETEGNVKAKRKMENEASSAKRPAKSVAEDIFSVSKAAASAEQQASLEKDDLALLPLNLHRISTFECEKAVSCSEFQPDLGRIFREFSYVGSITEEILQHLVELDDANLAMLA